MANLERCLNYTVAVAWLATFDDTGTIQRKVVAAIVRVPPAPSEDSVACIRRRNRTVSGIIATEGGVEPGSLQTHSWLGRTLSAAEKQRVLGIETGYVSGSGMAGRYARIER